MSNQKGSLSVILGIIIFLGLAAGLFFYFSDKSRQQTLLKFFPFFTIGTPSNPNHPKCTEYGPVAKEDYLTVYTILSKDTVESIAKSELKNPSRVKEIVILNNLSSENPNLKPGEKLYLPPFYINSSNGYIQALQGNIVISSFNNIQVWGVKELDHIQGNFPVVELNNRQLTDGQCVTVVYQNGPIASEQKILSITLE